MPDWCRSTLLSIGLALLGWLLLQEMSTERRLTQLETRAILDQARLDRVINKVVELLEMRK